MKLKRIIEVRNTAGKLLEVITSKKDVCYKDNVKLKTGLYTPEEYKYTLDSLLWELRMNTDKRFAEMVDNHHEKHFSKKIADSLIYNDNIKQNY